MRAASELPERLKSKSGSLPQCGYLGIRGEGEAIAGDDITNKAVLSQSSASYVPHPPVPAIAPAPVVGRCPSWDETR